MSIVKAIKENFGECADIIWETEMGKKYYPTKKYLLKEIEKGQGREEIYVVKTDAGDIQGVIWYQLTGMFHEFPYLHIVAVKDKYQNQGIGSKLLEFFERDVLKNGKNHISTKVFLSVGEFNGKAEKLYVSKGYEKLCEVEGLFRKNIMEKIYVKQIVSSV